MSVSPTCSRVLNFLLVNLLFQGRRHFTEYGWLATSATYPHPDPFSSFNLTDQTYVITGATSGIGKKVTELLSERGATVYMISRDEVRSNIVRDELRKSTQNDKIFSIQADVGLAQDVKRAVTEIKAHLKESSHNRNIGGGDYESKVGIDSVICNAGALLSERVLTAEGIETTLATHLIHGTYLLVNELLPVLENADDPRK
jgi:NAD(P)-dependent dehydrogenase (short-subunit alcohol dehydrogenase family)